MHTRIVLPERVDAVDLDRWLEDGWYRVGQVMMTTRIVVNDTGVRSAVWTRVPLDGYGFKRSHRKLLGRVERAFRVVEGPARADPVHEALYRRYLTCARGERPESLHDFLLGGHAADRFTTRELGVYDGDRLVAFSWYDVGRTSMQSLIGVYDPDVARFSLGFVSLLLEMREAMRLGLRHHYAGYVLPGDPQMDYKLRPGQVEYLEPETGRWRPWVDIDLGLLPAETLERRLEEARVALLDAGLRPRRMTYDLHHLTGPPAPAYPLLAEPLVLDLGGTAVTLMVAWDLDAGRYRLLRAARATAHRVDGGGVPLDPFPVWVVLAELAVANDPGALVAAVRRVPTRR